MLVFLEALRFAARPAARTTHFLAFRHLSTATFPPFPRQRTPSSILSLAPYSRRTLSLGSIFSRSQPQQTPSPLVVAHITRLEAEANVNPHDVSKQLALFQALADTKLKSSYDLIISRWERMCEFDNTSPVLHSPTAFQLYLTSLIHTGQKSSINPAVRRRDSLLASSPVIAPATNESSTASSPRASEATQTPSESSDAAATGESTTSPPPTSSQQIAEVVLQSNGEPAATQAGASTPGISKLQAAFESGGSSAPIQVSIVERKGSWIPRIIRFVALILVSSFFFLVILSVFFENTGFMKAGPKQSQFEPAEGKTVKFSDVHGVDEAKEELQDVVQFLKDPTAFANLGGKLPKGVLLTGPPGTGKTMLARAVAGEAGVPFFFASGSDFEEMFVGVGAKRVRELFSAARKKEPAIIFIDELDAVGGKRSSRDQQYMKQTLNQLLVEMDGFQQNEGVIVIAATNFPESLDQALVRPGRFDRIIAVPLPDVRGRVQILKHHMQGVVTSGDVDPKVLARGTPGFSGADLQNMVNQAAIQASKEHAREVTLRHFEWAKDRILMGAERKSHYIAHEAKLATAYHEGGHALVALYTDGAMPLHKVTCVPRGHALGYTSLLPEDDRNSVSLKEYLAGIDVSMGGRVAEELIYGAENVTSGASSDIRSATRTARSMVKQWGFSKLGPVFYDDRDENLSPQRKEEIEEEVTKIVRGGEARAMALLTERLEELHRLARALVEHETLDSEEVKKVIKGEQIRNITEVLDEELSNLESRKEQNP
ncbi:ATP-dependent peptidase [Lyophyllum atratum]|nr:ATP-dependent peptidase [Lyophyllum atratum]